MQTILFALALLFFQTTSRPASLEGVVVQKGTDKPVAKVSVLILKIGGQPADAKLVTTGDDGKFVATNLSAGRYSVVADRTGYVRFVYGQTSPAGSVGSIDLADGQILKDFDIRMTATGIISGRVFDANGEPAADIRVRAQKATYRDGQRSMSVVKEVSTNDLGEYRLAGLIPGQYFVSASALAGARLEGDRFSQPTPAADGTPAGTASMTFQNAVQYGRVDANVIAGNVFPEVFSPSAVELRGGATLVGVDLTLVQVHSVNVRGQVVNSVSGQALPRGSVSIDPRGWSARMSWRTTLISSTGAFDFGGLTPGSYVLRVSSDPSSANGTTAMASVDVGSTNIDNLSLVLRPLIGLNAHVTIEGRQPSDNDPDLPRLRITTRAKTTGYGPFANVAPNGNVAFTANSRLMPGEEYRVGFLELLPPKKNWYLKSAHLGPVDVLASGLQLDSETNGTLEIVVSPNSATLDCVVLDEHQKPLPGATVVLVPDVTHRSLFDLYRNANTDPSGKVHIEGIVPGEYKVFAWEEIEAGAWQDPEILRLYEPRGEAVKLMESGTQSVTVKVISSW